MINKKGRFAIISILFCFCISDYLVAQVITSEIKVEQTNDITTINGKLGIGTSSPTHILSVQQNGHVFSVNPHGTGVDLQSTGNFAPHYQTNFSIYKGIVGSGSLKFTIDENGFVGIGTSSPSHILSVQQNGHVFSVNPHGTGVDLQSTGNFAPHYQTNFSIYQGKVGSGSLRFQINENGNVGIGTPSSNYKLDVNGSIKGLSFHSNTNSWSDFVFDDNYELRSLEDTEKFIIENKHLPDIANETEVLENGINLGEMDAKLLQKIEELTLYVIEQNKLNKAQQEKIEQLEKKIDSLEKK